MTDQTREVLDSSPRQPLVARELAKEPLSLHYLQPGDELLLEVSKGDFDIRIPADQQLSAQGSLDLGKYGRINVASLTLAQAEQQIHQRLAEFVSEEFTVTLRLIQPVHHYYVIGEVNSPGAYSLTGYETVLDGIMAAGGLTARASACDALLARPTDPCSCRVTLPICYRAITQFGDTTTNYQLKPGDRIFIGRQTFCEEFLPCCSKKVCERCCKQQRACCDPRVAEAATPEFQPIAAELHGTVPTHDGELLNSDSYVSGSTQVEPLPDVSVAPWPSDLDPTSHQPGTQESSKTDQARQGLGKETLQPEHNTHDGQLDFDFSQLPADPDE
jgi:protein involved in polysaccharide export with SLBB domain